MYYPSETQVTPLTNVHHRRMLPVPGKVVVRVGDRVEPMQVVAHADVLDGFRIVPAARLLGVPVSRLARCMRVNLDDEVQRDQIIAKRRGLMGRSVKSPIDGTLRAMVGGRILIEGQPTAVELRAYVYGTVTNVIAQSGVVIETIGAVIQGVWGTGGDSLGVLKCLVKGPDELLEGKAIDPSCQGAILIGGAGLGETVFKQAQGLQLRGIVVGGLAPDMISQVEESPFPVVVTEGIGTVPMSKPIFRLLTTHEGREASISGRVQSRWNVVRPEIIIPMPAEALPTTQAKPGTPLTVGTQVRIVRAPHMGSVGKVVALPDHARRIGTGARVHGAEVDVGQRAPIFVPLANLEVLR
jgi:hypothetical protein